MLSSPSESFPRAMQEVGDDVILNCSSDREVHLCRWKTPYLNTYIVGEGIYVERGRDEVIQCCCEVDIGETQQSPSVDETEQ